MQDCAFSENGRLLAFTDADGACTIWGVKEKDVLKSIPSPTPGRFRGCFFSNANAGW